MRIKRVEFTLHRPEKAKQRINIRDVRRIFPGDKVQFTIRADNTDSTTDVYEPTIGENWDDIDHFHLRKWFDKNPNLKPEVTKLAIEVVTEKKEYNLKIISN